MPDGTCNMCPNFYVTGEDFISCIFKECQPRFKTLADGTCEECPDYQTPTESKKDCEKP